MTASERSYVGLAKQVAKGTPNTTDASFAYILFSEGSAGPQNLVIPLDQEVGGGAMLRSVIKTGVTSLGAFTIIPRPKTLGLFLLGALGEAAAPVEVPPAPTVLYKHTFTMPTDQFSAPYWTIRSAPGNMWGEQLQDMRLSSLTLSWRAADYLRGAVTFIGGLPTPNVSMVGWDAAAKVDKGPQFIAPVSDIELPTGANAKVLSGAVTMGMQIPMDEQWIVGSYAPEDFDINQRAFSVTLALKVTDATLYNKMSYDPANGAAWTADMFREAAIKLYFASDIKPETGIPYSIDIKANAQTGNNANVVWSATPIALRAGRQVTMAVTGTFVADPLAGEPITVDLVNIESAQY